MARYRCHRMELGKNILSRERERGKCRQLMVTHSPKWARKDQHKRQHRLDRLAGKLVNSRHPWPVVVMPDTSTFRRERSDLAVKRSSGWRHGMVCVASWPGGVRRWIPAIWLSSIFNCQQSRPVSASAGTISGSVPFPIGRSVVSGPTRRYVTWPFAASSICATICRFGVAG